VRRKTTHGKNFRAVGVGVEVGTTGVSTLLSVTSDAMTTLQCACSMSMSGARPVTGGPVGSTSNAEFAVDMVTGADPVEPGPHRHSGGGAHADQAWCRKPRWPGRRFGA
jgi:hypothetical protein